MKTTYETRLECLRLAAAMGNARVIEPQHVMPQAMEFYRWVMNGGEAASARDLVTLKEHFR